MQNLVAKLREKVSVLNKKSKYPKRVRTLENIVRVQEFLEQISTKSQRHLLVQVIIKRFCWNFIKNYIRRYPYKFSVVHDLMPIDKHSCVLSFSIDFWVKWNRGFSILSFSILQIWSDSAWHCIWTHRTYFIMHLKIAIRYFKQPLRNPKLGVRSGLSDFRIITRFFY